MFMVQLMNLARKGVEQSELPQTFDINPNFLGKTALFDSPRSVNSFHDGKI